MDRYSSDYILDPSNRLTRDFYLSNDVCAIAEELIGQIFFTHFNGQLTAGRIVETEAYKAPEDLASHARNNTRTPRTETFWCNGGTIYMYICYGIHNMLNIITGTPTEPHAILIRAIEPVMGIKHMQTRRNNSFTDKRLTGGPGRVAQALALDKSHNELDAVMDGAVGIVRSFWPTGQNIARTPRVGIDPVPEPWLSKPFRFIEKNNPCLSRPYSTK